MIFKPTSNPFKKKEFFKNKDAFKNFERLKKKHAEFNLSKEDPVFNHDDTDDFLSDVEKHINSPKSKHNFTEFDNLDKVKPAERNIETKEIVKPIFDKPENSNIKRFTLESVDSKKLKKVSSKFAHLNFKPNSKIKDETDDKFGRVTVVEAKQGINWTRAGLYLSALAMMGIVMFSQISFRMNPGLFILIWLFGMMCFLPLGLIAGWLFLDSYNRCKIMRRFSGKNYGIVNFLHKGGQRIVTRIKNLDDDVVVQDGRLWYLNKDGIHYLDKNNELVLHAEIFTEHIKTLPANIPCLFLDPETMNPISFKEEKSKTNPQQAGAIILGYINNQIRKNASMRKSNMIFYLIIIGVVIVNLVLGVQLYQWVEELHKVLPKINQLVNLLSQMTTPTSFIRFW